jgi:hypothetical protein
MVIKVNEFEIAHLIKNSKDSYYQRQANEEGPVFI